MSIDANLPRTIAAAAVIADEIAVVIATGLKADGVLELCYYCQGREQFSAVDVGADHAFGGNVSSTGGKTFEDGRLLAKPAFERQASATFETNGVRNLAL